MKCQEHNIQMTTGKAIKNTIHASKEGTCSRTGDPIMVDVYKCPECGHSVEK